MRNRIFVLGFAVLAALLLGVTFGPHHFAVQVQDTPTLIVRAGSNAVPGTIVNISADTVFLGDSAVGSSDDPLIIPPDTVIAGGDTTITPGDTLDRVQGLPLPPSAAYDFTLKGQQTLYGIVAADSARVSGLRFDN